MTLRQVPVAALLLLACGDDGPGGDDGDGATIDAAGTPDAAGEPDGSAPDAAFTADAAREPSVDAATDGGGDVVCPPPGEPSDGLGPVWLQGLEGASPLSVVEGPGCSAIVGGFTAGPAIFGRGQPGEVALEDPVWFAARYETDGTLRWVARLRDYAPDPALGGIDLVALPDGTTAAVLAVDLATREVFRLSADGVVAGPASVDGLVVRPRTSGFYVARGGNLEQVSADGEVTWRRSTGYPRSIVELPDGRVLHAGAYDFGGVTLNSGQPDQVRIDTDHDGCYVALHEVDGSLAWVRTIDLLGNLVPLCGVEAADGWAAAWASYPSVPDVVDFVLSTGAGQPVEAGTWQTMVIRYDLDGALAWYRGIIPAAEGELVGFEAESFSVGPATDGLVTLGGRMTGSVLFDPGVPLGGLVVVTSEPNQGWFARYTAAGELLGPLTFSSDEPGTSVVSGSATRSDGAAVLVGAYSGTLAFDPFALDAGGGWAAEVR